MGLYLSCNGGWEETINVFNGKCMVAFNNIKKNTNKLKLGSLAIFKLANDVIHQLIRFGIKFYSHSTEAKMNKLFKWQYIIARYALKSLSTCPNDSLEYLLNFEPIALICIKSILNTYETCARAPGTSLKNIVYDNFCNQRNEEDYYWCKINDDEYKEYLRDLKHFEYSFQKLS